MRFQWRPRNSSDESVDKAAIPTDSGFLARMIRVSSMQKASSAGLYTKSYRERLRAAGVAEVLFELPRETLAMIDDVKKRQGLPNRSQALLQLIERGMQTTQ